ncbi:MAG TPA: nitrogenase, partial [Erysipelotrichaceae bacterium]|nr:nitrogenase [Erysipelotrichaceae bacterium]
MKKIALSIGEASYPEPFSIGLEYNPPVHVTWNIVHIGMQVPDSMQVYICATNCMRGVIMTAYEMGAEDRFACVTLEESDILRGDMEKQIIDGVSESIRRYDKPLKAVIVFPVCIHKVLSTDLNYVYK